MENKETKTTTKKAKKWLVILLALCLVIGGGGIALYKTFFGETGNDSPVYGKNNRRCKVSTVISNEQIQAANDAISNIEGLVKGKVEVNCLTVEIELTYNESVSLETAKSMSTTVTHMVDDSMGFDRYNATDPYSKIFSVISSDSVESERMYDIHITIFNSANQYTIFGYKHYQSTEVVYTDQNPKDQNLVNSLHEKQGITANPDAPASETAA